MQLVRRSAIVVISFMSSGFIFSASCSWDFAISCPHLLTSSMTRSAHARSVHLQASSVNCVIFASAAALPAGAVTAAASTGDRDATFEIGGGGACVVLPHAASTIAKSAVLIA